MTETGPLPPCPALAVERRAPRRWARLPRNTVRLRLTLLYGSLFLLSGAGLLVVTFVLVANRLPVAATVRSGLGQATGGGAVISSGNGGCADLPRFVVPMAQAQIQQCLDQQRTAELTQLLTDSGIALAIMALAAIGLGWLVAGRVLRPLRTITATARHISASSLDERLALAGPDDELKELGDTFDQLLSRLESSFRAQRQFVSNASHELRTPAARQRTLMEVALGDPQPTVASLQAACRRVLAAGQQQEELIEALLTLARSERGLDRREPFDLAAVAGEVLRTRRPQAHARGISLDDAMQPAPALGDQRLAERAVANLVDNAIRHNAPGGRAELVTGTSAGYATISVVNTGPVIPADQVVRLFQPFQRLGAIRPAAARDGLGLGLTIVAAIAAAHDAPVQATALPAGGLAVTVWFPQPPPPPAGQRPVPHQRAGPLAGVPVGAR